MGFSSLICLGVVAINIQTPVMVHQTWISRHMIYICFKKKGLLYTQIIIKRAFLPKQPRKKNRGSKDRSCDLLRLAHFWTNNHLATHPLEAQTLQHLQVGDEGCWLSAEVVGWGGWNWFIFPGECVFLWRVRLLWNKNIRGWGFRADKWMKMPKIIELVYYCLLFTCFFCRCLFFGSIVSGIWVLNVDFDVSFGKWDVAYDDSRYCSLYLRLVAEVSMGSYIDITNGPFGSYGELEGVYIIAHLEFPLFAFLVLMFCCVLLFLSMVHELKHPTNSINNHQQTIPVSWKLTALVPKFTTESSPPEFKTCTWYGPLPFDHTIGQAGQGERQDALEHVHRTSLAYDFWVSLENKQNSGGRVFCFLGVLKFGFGLSRWFQSSTCLFYFVPYQSPSILGKQFPIWCAYVCNVCSRVETTNPFLRSFKKNPTRTVTPKQPRRLLLIASIRINMDQ